MKIYTPLSTNGNFQITVILLEYLFGGREVESEIEFLYWHDNLDVEYSILSKLPVELALNKKTPLVIS